MVQHPFWQAPLDDSVAIPPEPAFQRFLDQHYRTQKQEEDEKGGGDEEEEGGGADKVRGGGGQHAHVGMMVWSGVVGCGGVHGVWWGAWCVAGCMAWLCMFLLITGLFFYFFKVFTPPPLLFPLSHTHRPLILCVPVLWM